MRVAAAATPAIVGIMSRTERLTERAITFAIAEPNQDLAVARLAFLAHGDHPAVDAAIEGCLARHDRSLHTRWRAISFLARVRYEDHPPPGPPAAPTTASSGKGRPPGSSRGPEAGRPARLEPG